jgi:hypothetical protein
MPHPISFFGKKMAVFLCGTNISELLLVLHSAYLPGKASFEAAFQWRLI